MQYKPTNIELLEAVSEFIRKEILPIIKDDEDLSYKTLVSWNMLNVIIRDLEKEEEYLIKEIENLSELLNLPLEIPLTLKEKREKVLQLNVMLCEHIKKNKISVNSEEWKYVKKVLIDNLSISNPRYSI